MSQADRLMHDAHLRYQRSAFSGRSVDAVNDKVRSGLHRIAPRLNMSQAMLDHYCLNYYKYFCNHDRLLIEKCTRCKRKGIIG